jgi:D-3-phosphoglycerate dehydrogenase
MFKVMIRDNMSPVAREILEATGKIEVVVDNDKTTSDPVALAEIIGDFHGIAVRSTTKITDQVLKKAKKLKVIGRAGVGVDNIDISAATKNGVVVMNAPGGNTVTTAEHAISLMLALARNIPQGTASLREGKWEKKKLSGVEITGKTLGIIGLGHIGRIVAERANGLKMKVVASDPFVSSEAAGALDVELLPAAIKKMKPGVRIINASRGEIVNLDDLYDGLTSGHVAGAALDVFPVEPPDPSVSILKHPNVIFTPHLGASTGEAQDKVADMIARQIASFLIDDTITHAVNFPSVSREIMAQIRPHLNLAEKMGSLMGQLVRKIHDITITYSGDVAAFDTRPLTHAVLKGLLGSYTDTPVNYVSAPTIADAKGITVKETVSREKGDFANLIKVRLDGHQEGFDEIWGTIFGKKYPRIVRIGKIYLDAIPEGSMIIIQNIDKPGVIGNIGTTLGQNNLNIGRFQLGRLEDRALCMVNIDTPADEKVLEKIKSLPNIISARQVHLD